MIKRIGVVAIATLIAAGCSRSPITPTMTSPSPSTPTLPPIVSGIIASVSPVPFHVGMAGQIQYHVTDTDRIARLDIDGGNGASAGVAPASSSGTFQLVYATIGTFTVTITATTVSGRVLQAIVTVTVVS